MADRDRRHGDRVEHLQPAPQRRRRFHDRARGRAPHAARAAPVRRGLDPAGVREGPARRSGRAAVLRDDQGGARRAPPGIASSRRPALRHPRRDDGRGPDRRRERPGRGRAGRGRAAVPHLGADGPARERLAPARHRTRPPDVAPDVTARGRGAHAKTGDGESHPLPRCARPADAGLGPRAGAAPGRTRVHARRARPEHLRRAAVHRGTAGDHRCGGVDRLRLGR